MRILLKDCDDDTLETPSRLSTHLIKGKIKLDLHIGKQMQICIHHKDNSPKPVDHCLTLNKGPNAKFVHIRRFPARDFLYVGFTLQTSRTNNKRVISIFKFGCPCLTLKEGSKVKSDHIRRFPPNDFL